MNFRLLPRWLLSGFGVMGVGSSQGRSVLITISELALISNGSGYGWYASEGLIAAK
jgi:hypothetical protein